MRQVNARQVDDRLRNRPTLLVAALMTMMALLVGCTVGSTMAPSPVDQGPRGVDLGRHTGCIPGSTWATYHVDTLVLPTTTQAMAGANVGLDLDGVNEVCGRLDWPNQVDNTLITLADGLMTDLGIDIRAALEDTMCSPDGVATPRLRLRIRITTDGDPSCAAIEVRDAHGTTLAGPFLATVDQDGRHQGAGSHLTVTLPIDNGAGVITDVPLRLEEVRFTALAGAAGLSNITIGGQLVAADLEAALVDVLPTLNDPACDSMGAPACVSFADIAPILNAHYDVTSGFPTDCARLDQLTVGLVGSATLTDSPPRCASP